MTDSPGSVPVASDDLDRLSHYDLKIMVGEHKATIERLEREADEIGPLKLRIERLVHLRGKLARAREALRGMLCYDGNDPDGDLQTCVEHARAALESEVEE